MTTSRINRYNVKKERAMPISGYTKEQLHKLSERHRRMTGKVPTLESDPPVPVPESPLRNTAPSTMDLLWANRWNLVRHFVISGGGAAMATFTTTKDLTATGGAFVIGGIVGAVRKGGDDLRRSSGKPDLLTAAKNRITQTRGVDMAASDYNKAEVVAFGAAIGDLITAALDGVGADDLDELIEVVTTGAAVVNEMKDVPAAGGLHVLGAASDKVGDKFLLDAIEKEGPE